MSGAALACDVVGVGGRSEGAGAGADAASALVAGGVAMGCIELFGEFLTPLGRLLLGTSVLLSGYVAMLFYVMKQKAFYLDIVRTMRRRATVEKGLVPA